MPLKDADVERQITTVVVRRFLVDKEPAQRLSVARDFRNIDALPHLANMGVLKTNNGDDYFPTALAFHYCGVAQYQHLAREAVEIVVSVLQDLFLKELNKTDFTVADIEAHAIKLHGKAEPEIIRLGLYLAGEFGWLAGWGGNLEKYQITNLRISERVVTLKSFNKIWDEQIRQRMPNLKGPWVQQKTKKSRKTKRSNWEKICTLGTGGQSEVFLVRSPKRVAERATSLDKIQQHAGGCGVDGAAELAEAAYSYARPDQPPELGALKVFKARAQGPDAKQQMVNRLKNEIAVLSQNRPGLIRMLDSNVEEQWIVTEYYPNGTLEKQPLRYRGKAHPALVAFRSLVATVAALHKDNIVHRDIKPANIFVGPDEELILGDFGIVFTPSNEERATHTGERVGPRDYMPPWAEVGRLENVDANFDVYMLGKLLWCMVTGRPKLVREYYKRDESNPTVIFKDDPNMHAINQILDHCVVENAKDCLSSTRDLLLVVDTLLALIEQGGQLLNEGVPKLCRVCGRGKYQPAIQTSGSWSIRLWPRGTSIPTDTTLLALRPFACTQCGNVQFFKD
ncbi:MAG TPA: protein kinase [Candidatus Acidoferrum sp.]|nr:protein kinase [Candidatus Acidoferrum sp.]